MAETIETLSASNGTPESGSATETTGDTRPSGEMHLVEPARGTMQTHAASEGSQDYSESDNASTAKSSRPSQQSASTQSYDNPHGESSVTRLSQELLSMVIALEQSAAIAASASSREPSHEDNGGAKTTAGEPTVDLTKRNIIAAIGVLVGVQAHMSAMADAVAEAALRDDQSRADYAALSERHDAAVKSLEDVNKALQHDRDRLRAENEQLNAAWHTTAARSVDDCDVADRTSFDVSTIGDGSRSRATSTRTAANTTIEAPSWHLKTKEVMVDEDGGRRTGSSDGIGSGCTAATKSASKSSVDTPVCANNDGVVEGEGRRTGSSDGVGSGGRTSTKSLPKDALAVMTEGGEKPTPKLRIKELEEMRCIVEDLGKAETDYQTVLNVVCKIRTSHLKFKEKMAAISAKRGETMDEKEEMAEIISKRSETTDKKAPPEKSVSDCINDLEKL